MKINISERLKRLPPYLFVEIDKAKNKARDEGRDIIDLGIGDPDSPTPAHIIKALNTASKDPKNHKYALDSGMSQLRSEITRWYKERFSVTLDPDTEVLPLIGSKEGISHLPLAFINPGDAALVPNPSYPPYRSGTIFAGGDIIDMPLLEANSYLPNLDSIDSEVLKRAKILYLNYPNNPTGAVCDKDFYKRVVEFARKNNIIIASDAAYSELYFDEHIPPSILEIDGARDVAVEFHSLSKTYNMTGWRIGMACGSSRIIAALAKVKANVDSGIFNAIQLAGIAALKSPKGHLKKLNAMYRERRDTLVNGLNSIGWRVDPPKATFYVWAKAPDNKDSRSMCKMILEEADVVTTPGVGFGESGEGYVRMALTVSCEHLKRAVERIKKVL